MPREQGRRREARFLARSGLAARRPPAPEEARGRARRWLLGGLPEDSQRTPRGITEDSQRTSRGLPEDSHSTPRGLAEQSREESRSSPSRRLRGLAEEDSRGLAEQSRRARGGVPEESLKRPGGLPEDSWKTPRGLPKDSQRAPVVFVCVFLRFCFRSLLSISAKLCRRRWTCFELLFVWFTFEA